MSVTINGESTPLFDGTTLRHRWNKARTRVEVEYWYAHSVVTASVPANGDDVQVVSDATPEIKALAERARTAAEWFAGVQARYAALAAAPQVGDWGVVDPETARVGDTVEVYKGRKCPKGTYEIAVIGHNDFGPFVHLRDAAGDWHRYINPANLRRPAVSDARLAEAAGLKPGPFTDRVVAALAAGNGAGDWTAVTDWLRSNGHAERADILAAVVCRHFAPARTQVLA